MIRLGTRPGFELMLGLFTKNERLRSAHFAIWLCLYEPFETACIVTPRPTVWVGMSDPEKLEVTFKNEPTIVFKFEGIQLSSVQLKFILLFIHISKRDIYWNNTCML